jgi:hypothetical protein
VPFVLVQTRECAEQLQILAGDPSLAKRYRAVAKCLRLLANNPRHPGLNTHKYSSLTGARGEEVFEAYAENKTPGAYRVFWHYGSNKGEITILSVTPHP